MRRTLARPGRAFRDGLEPTERASCNPEIEGKPDRRRSGAGTNHAFTPGMKDLLFVAIAIGFFAIAWIYVRAAERL
jgi:hypothetical protein